MPHSCLAGCVPLVRGGNSFGSAIELSLVERAVLDEYGDCAGKEALPSQPLYGIGGVIANRNAVGKISNVKFLEVGVKMKLRLI